jgi:hypothetical protein
LEVDHNRLGERSMFVLAFLITITLVVPNAAVLTVWAFTVANEWFLFRSESVAVYSITMCLGGPLSLVGLAIGALGLLTSRERWTQRCWWASLAINGAGLVANCLGFIVYMSPGC